MQNCWKRAASERLHFEVIMEILSNYLEHLRRDSVSSDGDSDEGAGGFERQGSRKSKNSSIRSGKGGHCNSTNWWAHFVWEHCARAEEVEIQLVFCYRDT